MCKWVFWALFLFEEDFAVTETFLAPKLSQAKQGANLGVKKVEVNVKSPKKMVHYVVFQLKK
jgi:hypothetical protein